MNDDEDIYDHIAQIAFNGLVKNNRMLIAFDKGDEFFHAFFDRYKVCNVALVGSVFEDIPWVNGYSVTNLGDSLRNLYLDGCLNAPADVVYLDVTTKVTIDNYLDQVITDNTTVILRIKHPEDTNVPSIPILRNKNVMRFGDWDEKHTQDSEYFLIFL